MPMGISQDSKKNLKIKIEKVAQLSQNFKNNKNKINIFKITKITYNIFTMQYYIRDKYIIWLKAGIYTGRGI